MAGELITSWGDYQAAIDRLLPLASQKISIYDEDLGQFKLESADRRNELQRLLQANRGTAVHIALRNADPLRQRQPRLLGLLATYGQQATARQTPAQLAHLRDSMLLVDDRHALIRFDREQPRSKLLIDAADELAPYLTRYREIWSEGGETIGSVTLGL